VLQKIFLFFFLLSFSYTASTLTIKEFLSNIIKNDPAYKQLFTEMKNIKGAIESLQVMYDPTLQGRLDYTLKDQQFASFGGTPFLLDDNQTLIASVSLAKTLEDSATNINLSYSRAINTFKITTNDYLQVNPALSIKITQPLWKNFMGVYSKLPNQRISIQKEIVELALKEAEEKYFLEAIEKYYDWGLLTLSLEPLIISYKNSRIIYAEVLRKYKSDAVLKSDLLQAENSVLILMNTLNDTLYAWNVLASDIYQKMDEDFSMAETWDKLPIVPEIDEKFAAKEHDQYLPNVRMISTIEKMLEQYQLDAQAIEREKMPDLSVFAELTKYNNLASEENSFLNLEKNEFNVGVNFFTFLDHYDVSGKRQSLSANIYNTEQELIKTKRMLNEFYQNNLWKIKHLNDSQNNSKRIADNSKEILDLEEKRFSLGKTSLFSLSEYRQRYVQNNIDYLRKKVELSKLKASLMALTDELLEEVYFLIGANK
jgi:hypothetical protein